MPKTKKSTKPKTSRSGASDRKTKSKIKAKPSIPKHAGFHISLLLFAILVIGSAFAYKSLKAHAIFGYPTSVSDYVWSSTSTPTSPNEGHGWSNFGWPVPLDAMGDNPPATNSGFLTYTMTYPTEFTGDLELQIYDTRTQGNTSFTMTGNPIIVTTPAYNASYSINRVTTNNDSFNYTVKITWSASANPTASPVSTPKPAPTPAPKDTTPPTVPTGLSAKAVGPNEVDLAWNASVDSSSGISAYNIYRGTGSSDLSLLKTITTSSYIDKSVGASTTYYYYVTAVDKAGNTSSASGTVNATSPALPPPLPTVSISNPRDGSTESGIIDVNGWAGNGTPPIKSVQVEVDNNGFVTATSTTTNGNDADWEYKLNTRLYTDTMHTITAKAVDWAGTSNTTSIKLTFKNGSYSATPPLSQGTWVSPEGMTVNVDSKGKNPHTGQQWTIADAYYMVKACAAGTGDFATLAPIYTINILDDVGNLTGSDDYTVLGIGTGFSGNWSNYGGTSYLLGSAGPMLQEPYDVVCYEYGHVWTNYYYYIVHYPESAANLHGSGMTAPPMYMNERWVSKDGTVTLAQKNYCAQTTDGWDGCMTDDRRILFGGPGTNGGDNSADRVPGEPDTGYQEPNIGYINNMIVPPSAQPGLADWYMNQWMAGQ